MSKELRIKRGEVELAVYFNNKEELIERLSDYEEIIKIIKEKVGDSFEPVKTIRKDLEGIIAFENGKRVLVKAPKTKAGKVCLVLYSIGSDGATPEEISMASHVNNPSRSILHNRYQKKTGKQESVTLKMY
jgi:hypothetical protein